MQKINVNADALRIVSAFISKEETRYYLNGVYIHAHPCGGAVLVATDGHRMLIYYDRSGECDSPQGYIIPINSTLKKATKRGKDDMPSRVRKGEESLRFQWDGKTATIQTKNRELRYSAELSEINGSFPDYQRLIPLKFEGSNSRPATFNAEYIADFEEAARDLKTSGLSECQFASMSICQNSQDCGPVLVRINDDDNVCAVLVPMRGNATTEPPAFLHAKPYKKPEIYLSLPEREYLHSVGYRWHFNISTRVSEISETKTKAYGFTTRQQAERAFNRVRESLVLRGVGNLPARIDPAYHFTKEQLAERERRAQRKKDALETFEGATCEDISKPWRVQELAALHSKAFEHKNARLGISPKERAIQNLPYKSEFRAIAAAYQKAA